MRPAPVEGGPGNWPLSDAAQGALVETIGRLVAAVGGLTGALPGDKDRAAMRETVLSRWMTRDELAAGLVDAEAARVLLFQVVLRAYGELAPFVSVTQDDVAAIDGLLVSIAATAPLCAMTAARGGVKMSGYTSALGEFAVLYLPSDLIEPAKQFLQTLLGPPPQTTRIEHPHPRSK